MLFYCIDAVVQLGLRSFFTCSSHLGFSCSVSDAEIVVLSANAPGHIRLPIDNGKLFMFDALSAGEVADRVHVALHCIVRDMPRNIHISCNINAAKDWKRIEVG